MREIMRGSTKKKLEKFVDILIANTPPNELGDVTREALLERVKQEWKDKGDAGQKFIDQVVSGKFFNNSSTLKKK